MLRLLSFGLISLSFDPHITMPVQNIESGLGWELATGWMESVLPRLQIGVALIVYYWVTVLLPLYFFRRMHPLIVSCLRVSSILIGVVCWWQSILATYQLLGALAVIIGTLCGILGVVPMALYATGAKGDWDLFGNIILTGAAAIVPRVIAKFIVSRESARLSALAEKSYYIDD